MKRKKNRGISRLRLRLLSLFCRRIYSDSVQGDCEEMYDHILWERGKLKAESWLWLQLIKSLPLFLLNALQWGAIMSMNHLKVALRNMIKHKGYSLINLVGLSMGLACCFLIMVWVQNEKSYDQFHEKGQDIYRIIGLGKTAVWGGMPGPLGPAVVDEVPEVTNMMRCVPAPTFVMKAGEQAFYEKKGLIADQSIFEMFSFPLLRGDKKEAFSSTMNIILSESMARRYFGTKDPLNQLINIEGRADLKVAAIMKDIPENSHLQFDYVVPFQFVVEQKFRGMGWGDFNFRTYVQSIPETDPGTMAKKIQDTAIRHKSPQIVQKMATLSVQPLTEMYLHPLTRYDAHFGNIRHVRLFVLIAAVILLIALINFINLATARSETRAKEISMRKVTGARRSQLVRQFMGESLLFTLIATAGAVLLIQLMLPWFRTVTGKSLPVNFLNPSIWLILGGLAVVSGLGAGIYPALFLSGQSPVWGRRSSKNTRSGTFRKTLVILQFAVSVGLMVGTWVIYDQLNFMRQKNWHLEDDIVLHVPVKENVGTQYEVFKNSLLSNPRITGIGVKNCLPTYSSNNTSGVYWPGKTRKDNEIFMETTRVDYDYFKTVGMEIIAGREFSPDFPSDQKGAFILNETAVRLAGLKDPVGKPFRLYDQPGLIIGVVKDTYFKSLKRELNPQVYHMFTDFPRQAFFGSVFIRIQKTLGSRDLRDMIAFIGQKWRDLNSVAPFEYHFLDDTIRSMYANDQRLGKIVTSFCFLAIFISCLGLFGLSAFIVQKRVREIGIRKTLGASSRQLAVMLSGEFSRWVLISFLIAMPAAYYLMKGWLQNFAYRTGMGIEIFILSGALALVIAVLTVSYQAVRAAAANPVDTIKER